MPLEDDVRIRHILDAAQEAISFAHGQTVVSLEADHMRALAITRLLEIVGEAAASVSTGTKAAHPEIPWRIMSATRNRLIHAYFNVNLEIVLETTKTDLPPLVDALTTLLELESNGEGGI